MHYVQLPFYVMSLFEMNLHLIPEMLTMKMTRRVFRPRPVDGAKTPAIITSITVAADRHQTAEWQFVALF